MVTRVAINGFGRIGRQVLRATMERYPDELEVVAVNDLADPKTNAYLFQYDTNYGVYPGHVHAHDDGIHIDDRFIKSLSERDPAKLPWSAAARGCRPPGLHRAQIRGRGRPAPWRGRWRPGY